MRREHCSVPGIGKFHRLIFDLGIPEFRGKTLIHMIDFQLASVRQLIGAPHFRNQRKADEILQIAEFIFCDVHLNFFADKAGTGFETEDIFGFSAGHRLFPNADSRADTDISLPHFLFIDHRIVQLLGKPSVHHPFSFYFHKDLHFEALGKTAQTISRIPALSML